MSHWAEKYIGISYKSYDCAQLVELVLYHEFGKILRLPEDRGAGLRSISAQIDNSRESYGESVSQPIEGDAVLMVCRGLLNHIGIYCSINGQGWVLHAQKNVGHTCLHRISALPQVGIEVEGYYRWI